MAVKTPLSFLLLFFFIASAIALLCKEGTQLEGITDGKETTQFCLFFPGNGTNWKMAGLGAGEDSMEIWDALGVSGTGYSVDFVCIMETYNFTVPRRKIPKERMMRCVCNATDFCNEDIARDMQYI